MNFKNIDDGKKIEPTKAELEILQVLWANGPSTVRFVNDKLNEQRGDIKYTSTLKLMQIMTEKGIVKRDESQMKHIYHAVVEEKKTMDNLLNRFVESAYKGSVSKLVLQLLGSKKTSKEDIAKIKEVLNNMGKK